MGALEQATDHRSLSLWPLVGAVRSRHLAAIIAGSLAAAVLGCRPAGDAAAPGEVPPGDYRRIVSTAPNVTETLFALGLEERVVGVTRYCRFPPAARERPQVGGFLDPNFEAILALDPDLVVAVRSLYASHGTFDRLGLRVLVVEHHSVDDVLASIAAIGRVCGVEAEATAIIEEMTARMTEVARHTEGRPRPRVMLVVERPPGRLADVFVAATDGYFDRLIATSGGRNAFAEAAVPFPTVSVEGILAADPEVIVELAPPVDGVEESPPVAAARAAAIAADWEQLPQVAAVREGRVHVLTDPASAVPGPRYVGFLERLAELIHPEVTGDSP